MVVMLSGFVPVPGAQIYYEVYTPEQTQQKQAAIQTLMCTSASSSLSVAVVAAAVGRQALQRQPVQQLSCRDYQDGTLSCPDAHSLISCAVL
jgi:hypothetical protein